MQRTEPELERSAAEQLAKESCVVPLMDREVLPLSGSEQQKGPLVVNNKKAPSLGPNEWITKENASVPSLAYILPQSQLCRFRRCHEL
jgi:hypothetical protein